MSTWHEEEEDRAKGIAKVFLGAVAICIIGAILYLAAFLIKVNFISPSGVTAPEVTPPSSVEPSGVSFEDFLKALASKESNNNPTAICPDGCCVGLYQITEQYVDDINWRIPTGREAFTYADRLNPEKAGLMVGLYLQHYVVNRLVDYDWSTLARVHHGGPNGWDKEYTKQYGEDVVKRLK